ncbi:Cytoplasmic dynein 2 intermediate chain 1 [Pseudolycoriella hygida]|uniref:Cytoplasmic dynein 2 intermediate chain 1 n=1 Tax=Pseudolycoriella hygida TaxID=35572 RepID=A0A9Q0S8M1_9DIPT|nr:Cytoplasmic dynein 2 intermediate chain 1 [Pseudolycoriella hygida]
MNTIHNVTVTSPPSIRKDLTIPHDPNVETLPRERTKTRTLQPDEVVVLKQSTAPQKVTTSSESHHDIITDIEPTPAIIPEPIAFEITFEKAASSATIDSSRIEPESQHVSDGDYEDDFDSYESDFETESSTSAQSLSTSSESENASNSTSGLSESQAIFSPAKKLEDNRDFDSGTYELKGTTEKLQPDSIDERELHSDGQNDSGFGYINATPSPVEQSPFIPSITYSKPPMKSTYNRRGMELMEKITLDTMTFSLFELKPLSYDLFMKIYGHKNTNQSSSQTVGNSVDHDVQTEQKSMHSMWTQYPPSFSANETVHHHENRIGCGEGIEDENSSQNDDTCLLEKSLKIINRSKAVRDVRSVNFIDYERLNFFLQKSAITLSAINNANEETNRLQKSDSIFSEGFFHIPIEDSKLLNDTEVYYTYSNESMTNVVYLAHRQKSSSRTHDSSLVSVWNILDTKKPMHVLSCWSLVICLEVHHYLQDTVIGGLTDGSVAVWNLSESTSWNQNSEIPPTQIVTPTIDTKSLLFDFGCIVSLKSVHTFDKTDEDEFKLTQVYSLHEFGILTVWTILKTNCHSSNSEAFNERKIDHRSPWSKTQLIQSNIIDLTSTNLTGKVRPKSGFEKKKMYFESNLFNDVALRELQNIDSQKMLSDQTDNFRCVDMECHEDVVVVATNKSFLIFVAASLNRNSLRRLMIDESNFLHATKLKSLDDVLSIGLIDGSVKVMRVKSSNLCLKSKDKNFSTNPPPLAQNSHSAKSCAIQNIIKEERKFFDDGTIMEPSRKSQNIIEDKNQVRDSRFINNQTMLPAMSLNRDFVKWMEVSVSLNCMMVLCGNHLRIVNLENFSGTPADDTLDVKVIGSAALVVDCNNREYMVSLEDNKVRVHLLRKKKL